MDTYTIPTPASPSLYCLLLFLLVFFGRIQALHPPDLAHLRIHDAREMRTIVRDRIRLDPPLKRRQGDIRFLLVAVVAVLVGAYPIVATAMISIRIAIPVLFLLLLPSRLPARSARDGLRAQARRRRSGRGRGRVVLLDVAPPLLGHGVPPVRRILEPLLEREQRDAARVHRHARDHVWV